jgi:hypothetical protein
MLSGELGRLLTMYEMEAQCGFTPGKPVARVKASDLKAMWKLGQDVNARRSGTQGAVGIGSGMVQRVCGPGVDVNAVFIRNARLAMLMMMCGKRDAQPPAILFSIFAKLPMKW